MKDVSLNTSWIRQQPIEEHLADDVDYYALFYLIKQTFSSCYMFESLALPRHQDRFYTIGFNPAVEFIARENTLTITGKPEIIAKLTGTTTDTIVIETANPYTYLQSNIPLQYQTRTHQGGLIGYFSYEAANYFEPALQLDEPENFSLFHLGLYLDGLIYDSMTGSLHYYSLYDNRSQDILELIKQTKSIEAPTSVTKVINHGNNFSKSDHKSVVQDTLQQIAQGNTFQGEVGMKTDYTITGDKIGIYSHLRAINPSPYMFYVVFDKEELLGASPEILVACSDGEILTTPTAGTTRRGTDKHEDQALARTLLESEKDLAEHRMLVDLHRNDIAKVSKVETVKVRDLMYIIKFSHVQHIVSDITGVLADDKDAYDLLAAIMPGGVVTGAPKIETMKIIARNEGEPRGPYGGAIGRFSLNGDMAFCLPIRSLFCHEDSCYSQTCSGIVFDSNPEAEYQEVINKLAAMSQTILKAAQEDGDV